MNKFTYYIKMNSEDLSDFDPNLELAVKDIIKRMRNTSSSGIFDFEIIGLYDGYISNLKFNTCLNAFLHDMISGPDSYFTSLQENKLNDYAEYVKLFIAHFNDLDRDIRMYNTDNGLQINSLDVFKEFEHEGECKSLNVHIFIPVDENEYIKPKLKFGPDYMIMVLTMREMFNYLMAPLYCKLYDLDLLDNEDLKRITTYMIGIH